jgi:hypothetical protein
MSKQKTTLLTVEGIDIRYYSEDAKEYFSLTDMAKRGSNRPEQVIQNWLRNRDTIEFLGLWEKLHNDTFNHLEFEVVKNRSGLNSFAISVSDWTTRTGAIGIMSKAGRYGGGTYAHRDIAFEFGSWVNPSFKLLIIKEFQRLKALEAEQQKQSLEWNVRRILSKVNYQIHTDAIKNQLIPEKVLETKLEGLYYATEADLLNLALFGMTAKEWRETNPTLKGNMRDYATAEQLLVLANLENLNAEFIKMNWEKTERFHKLNDIAIYQMALLVNTTSFNTLKEEDDTIKLIE